MKPEHTAADTLRVLLMATTFPRWEDDTMPQFVYELSKELNTQSVDVVVLAPHYPGAERKETMSGITVYRYPYMFPYRYQKIALQGNGGILPSLKQSPIALLQLPVLIASLVAHTVWIYKKERIDVINSHWLLPNGVIAGALATLFDSRHVMTLHARGVLLIQRLPFGSVLAASAYRWSDAILPVSRDIQDRFIAAANGAIDGTEKFQVQPMGAHTSEYDTDAKGRLRAERNVDDTVRGLFVGRLADKKGIRYLLDAIADAEFTADAFRLTVVGSGPLEDDLRRYAEELDLGEQVAFTGWVSEAELQDQYVLSDFVVVPSIETDSGDTEGMPTVIAEAFAAGNPVVATTVGGIPDVVSDGTNGYIVPQKQPAELAEAMSRLIDNPARREELSDGALATAAELDWSRCAEQYARTLQDVQGPTAATHSETLV